MQWLVAGDDGGRSQDENPGGRRHNSGATAPKKEKGKEEKSISHSSGQSGAKDANRATIAREAHIATLEGRHGACAAILPCLPPCEMVCMSITTPYGVLTYLRIPLRNLGVLVSAMCPTIPPGRASSKHSRGGGDWLTPVMSSLCVSTAQNSAAK